MRSAAFARTGETIVPQQTHVLREGEQLSVSCANDRSAWALAMMAAGLAKATSGAVFIGAFDPRIQPVQVKRLAGYVPYEAVPQRFLSFERYVEYRAALWGLESTHALKLAKDLQSRLLGIHEAFAYPLIGALIAEPRLLVLDRPQAAYAQRILLTAGATAIFSTHANENEALAFRKALIAA